MQLCLQRQTLRAAQNGRFGLTSCIFGTQHDTEPLMQSRRFEHKFWICVFPNDENQIAMRLDLDLQDSAAVSVTTSSIRSTISSFLFPTARCSFRPSRGRSPL